MGGREGLREGWRGCAIAISLKLLPVWACPTFKKTHCKLIFPFPFLLHHRLHPVTRLAPTSSKATPRAPTTNTSPKPSARSFILFSSFHTEILTDLSFLSSFQIASYDQTGPHLFQTDPSGAYYEYVAQAIGSRAQSGKTYLEKYYAEFEELGVDDLIKHALKALSGTTGKERRERREGGRALSV